MTDTNSTAVAVEQKAKAARALTLAERIKANKAARAAADGQAKAQAGQSQHKPAKRGAKANKARKLIKARAGWKLGTPKRADGKTGENSCLCGCETMVKNRFAQGHDARVHGWLLQVEEGEKTLASLPAITRRAIEAGVIAHKPKTGAVIGSKVKQTKAA